jgi:hypothetical protein
MDRTLSLRGVVEIEIEIEPQHVDACLAPPTGAGLVDAAIRDVDEVSPPISMPSA